MNVNLKGTEQLLWRLITAPEGVAKALQDSRVANLPIRGDSRMTNAKRLDIYANMYFYRIRDSLKEDFPAVHRLLGEERFHNLVTDYLLRHPPTHWSLRYAGRELPRFLLRHPLRRHRPFLSDLARFEWALLESFDAPDAPVLNRARLCSLPPGRWNGLRLRAVPSLQCLRFRWPVDRIRRRTLRGGGGKGEAVRLCIWRRDLKVWHRPVDREEEPLLLELRGGTTFGRLCARAAARSGTDRAVLQMTRLLGRWVREGILAR